MYLPYTQTKRIDKIAAALSGEFMSNLDRRPDFVSTSGIESILLGDNPEHVRRHVQILSPSLKRENERWITVQGPYGPLMLDSTTFSPWQKAWYQASKYIEQDDWPSAIQAIHESLRLRPRSNMVWALYAMLGMTYLKVDDFERSSGALNKAIKLNPSDGVTQFALGSAYLKWYLASGNRNKLRKAVKPFRAAIHLKHEIAHCYFYLGLVYSFLEEWQQAEAAYSKAISLQNDFDLAYRYLAKVYLHLAQRDKKEWKSYYQKAIRTFRRLTAVQPTNSQAYNFIGFFYRQLGDIEAAAREFEKAVEANRDNFLALMNLGTAYLELRRFEEARPIFQQIIRSKPQTISAYFEHELELPVNYIRKGVNRFLSDALTCYGVACIELYNLRSATFGEEHSEATDSDLVREAELFFIKAIKLAPDNIYAYHDLAALYYQQNRLEDAQEIIRRLLALDPDDDSIKQYVQKLLQEQLKRRLLAKGVVKEIREQVSDFRPYRNRMMMTVRGKPLSQLVIEGRR